MKRYHWFFVFFLAAALSCEGDKSVENSYGLEGKWEVYEAYRDGDLTTTLEDAYFEFRDSILETNLMGSPISGTFSMGKDGFSHESALKAEYAIDEFRGDTMHLKTEIRNFDFLFKLRKERDTLPSKI